MAATPTCSDQIEMSTCRFSGRVGGTCFGCVSFLGFWGDTLLPTQTSFRYNYLFIRIECACNRLDLTRMLPFHSCLHHNCISTVMMPYTPLGSFDHEAF